MPTAPEVEPKSVQPSRDIKRLLDIMSALRDPQSGCPWDLAQTFRSILPYTIEEAFEVADAIERDDRQDLRDELGDLLLQVVFYAQMASEESAFDFGDVVEAITAKLIRRHPHVFGDARSLSPEQVKAVWASIKRDEKAARAASRPTPSSANGVLSDIIRTLPPLTRALKLQAQAATVGFDWNDPMAVVDKIREELDETVEALRAENRQAQEGEIGDLLFAVVNLARHADIDPDLALRSTNAKFERRFAHIEAKLAEAGLTPAEASLGEMEALWSQAKRSERAE